MPVIPACALFDSWIANWPDFFQNLPQYTLPALSVLIQIVRYNNVKDPKMSECFVTFCGGNYKKCVCYSSSYGSPWIVNVYL